METIDTIDDDSENISLLFIVNLCQQYEGCSDYTMPVSQDSFANECLFAIQSYIDHKYDIESLEGFALIVHDHLIQQDLQSESG